MRLDERPAIDRLTMGAEYDELREAFEHAEYLDNCHEWGPSPVLARVRRALEALHLI